MKISTLNTPIYVKLFIKWACGKSALLDDIIKFYPNNLGKKINRYCEPFVGGGAVLFDVLLNYNLDEIYINDANSELITLNKTIKSNAAQLICILMNLQNKYIPLDTEKKNIIM